MRHKREIQMSKENENRKNLRSRYFLTRLMASFGIMLILPVFLAVVNYLWSRNVLEKETIRYNQAMLDQAQAVIDEKLQGIQLYAFELSQNDSLNPFLRENQMEQGELLVEVERQAAGYTPPAEGGHTPSEETVRLTNAINRGLEKPEHPEEVVALIMQSISARYACFEAPAASPDTQRLIKEKAYAQAIKYITITADNAVTVTFK